MFSFITNYLEPFAFLVYFIALLIHYKDNKTIDIKLLVIYYMLLTALQLWGSLEVKLFNVTNIWMYDLAAFFTSIFLGIYFYRLFPVPTKQKTVIVLTGIYIAYVVLRELTLTSMRLFDSIGYAIISASLAIYVFMYYGQILRNVSAKNILNEFNFWLASGYLFYYVGCFFIFVSYYYFTTKYLANQSRQVIKLLTALWGVHNVLLFISALSLLIGTVWINSRKKLV